MEMSGQLYPWVKRPWYLLFRGLGCPQSQYWCSGEEKKSHHWPFQDLNPTCPAHSLVSIVTELSCLTDGTHVKIKY